MVVRETLQMADPLVRSELRVPAPASVEPLTVDVLGDRNGDSTTTLNADEPTYEVKQGGTRLSSQNLAVLTSGLKIVTSLRGHFVTKVKSIDGLSASSRKSEDDDGYCSRSSLDSPVQISRPDAVSPTTEDSVETFTEGSKNGCRSSPASPLPSSSPGQHEECIRSCDGANDELKVDCNSQTAAAVTSLDHCYLMAKAPSSSLPDGQLPSPVDGGDVPQNSLDSDGGPSTVDDTAGKSLSAAGRRNISIFVVPQPMPSSGLRWRARIIRADATSSDQAGCASDAGQGTSSCSDVDKLEVSAVQASTSTSTTWLPLSAVAGADCGRVKSTVGTSATTSVVPGRRSNGYRQRLTVGSRLAALTATADSLSRQIARVAASSARTGGREVRRQNASERRRAADYHLRDLSVRLHPLVDHDYGAFATFNAEVQSSIISTTTDGVSQMDWRSIRRHRTAGARTRPGLADTAVEQPGSPAEADVRPKRKYCRRQQQDLIYGLGASYAGAKPQRVPGRKGRPPSLDIRRQPVARKRPLHHDPPLSPSVGSDDGKSYVKIPGHYQDDFVYYATKRARGRPRKSLQDPTTSTPTSAAGHVTSRPTAVGGINVFDWYREMAQTDKSTRFGVPTTRTDVAERPPEASPGWADTTPVDESAVADLVMDMLPSSTASGSSSTPDYSGGTFSRPELTVTEEDVCAMLRSLNEADLNMLESHLGSAAVDHEDSSKTSTFDNVEKVEADTGGDGNLSQYLNDCGRDSLLPLSQTSTSSGLLDVDEISDGDLLSADIGNMHVILSDLRTPTRDLRITHLPVTSKSNLSALFENNDYGIVGGEFPCGSHQSGDVEVQTLIPESSTVAPPELCVVNMFWNDLPGLMMEGREYVRLVDIHRQVLPAKDTGILKKRCYMLGLDVLQCSELQRDFLIRYMNAAKSKSTVVVSRTDAIHLIGFYVTPKSKTRSADADDALIDSRADSDTVCDLTASGARQRESQQCAAVGCRPAAAQQLSSSPLMTQQPDRVSSLPPQATTTVAQSDKRRRSAENVSPLEGVKRSERLRDRRVHYVDMVHGLHPRHGEADGADIETKTGDTGCQQNSHHLAPKPGTGHLCLESSVRTGHRASSTERREKLVAAPVEPLQGAAPANCRRRSMELRSSTDTRTDEVAVKRDAVHPLTTGLSVAPPGGRRRPSGLGGQQARQEDIPHATVTSGAAKVGSDAERPADRAAAVLNRRRRGSSRHRRRMAARRRSRLFPVSTQLADPSPGPSAPTSQLNRSSDTDCSQQTVATIDVDEQEAHSTVESVEFADAVDASVSEVADDGSCKMLKMDSVIVQNSVGCDESENVAAKTLPNKTSVSTRILALHASRSDGIDSYRVKAETPPLTNLVPVMHVDFSNRVGRPQRSEDGVVLLDRYISADAACVHCCSCSELFSVVEFIRHMHHESRVSVGSVRRLGPRGGAGPEWHEFQRRRAEFAVGISSRTPVNPPPANKFTDTTILKIDISPAPAVNLSTENVSEVLAVDEVGKSKSLENLPLAPVVKEETTRSGKVRRQPSTPVSGQHTKSAGAENSTESPPPVSTVEEVVKSIGDVVDVSFSRPQKGVVVPASCPAAVEETSAAPEPRVTRSRHASVGHARPSPGKTSVRRQSGAVENPNSAPRHSERSCKRVRVDSATTPTLNGDSGDGIGTRLELRPRQPPRTTAPK